MSKAWVAGGLCRCCHAEGNFKSLEMIPYFESNRDTFSMILKETFDITLLTSSDVYNICNSCEPRLKDAALFKRQIKLCEERFTSLYFGPISVYGPEGKVKFETEVNAEPNENKVENEILDNEAQDEYSEHGIDLDDIPLCDLKSVFSFSEDQRHHSEYDTKPLSKLKKKFPCEICEKKFTYFGSLEVHMKIHSGEKLFHCHICQENYPTNRELTLHFGEKHRTGNTYPCTVCKKVFEKPRLLKKHLKSHFAQKFKCPQCGKEFVRKKGLKEHLKTHTGEKKYQCHVCSKSFGHNQTLKSHIYTHTGEKPYICDVCGRRFPQRTHLKRHIYIIHNQIKNHLCSVCNKKFSSKSYLLIHERTHTGEKPFSCEICMKKFTAYTTLKVHSRIHTGLKPYSCNFCDRTFAQLASFKLHSRTHTGEKPFSCKICMKSFSDNGYLKIHMRVHTGLKPFSCETCKRSFRENGQLKRHLRTHTGAKAYTCKVCNKEIGNLSKHMKVHAADTVFVKHS